MVSEIASNIMNWGSLIVAAGGLIYLGWVAIGALGAGGAAAGGGAAAAGGAGAAAASGLSLLAHKMWDTLEKTFLFIWDVIKHIFQWVILSAPGFLKVIFFILLFWLFGSFIMNNTVLASKECDSSGNIMTANSFYDIIDYKIESAKGSTEKDLISKANSSTAGDFKKPWYYTGMTKTNCAEFIKPTPNPAGYTPEELGLPSGITSTPYYYDSGSGVWKQLQSEGRWYYTGTCAKCNKVTLYYGSYSWPNDGKDVCEGVAYHNDELAENPGKGSFTSMCKFYNFLGTVCNPPEGSKFDPSSATSAASVPDYVSLGSGDVVSKSDYVAIDARKKVLQKQADALKSSHYKKDKNQSTYKDPVGFHCVKSISTSKYEPNVTVFGIPIFDIRVIGVIIAFTFIFGIIRFFK